MAAHVFVANEVTTAANLNSLLPPMADQAGIVRMTPVANTATPVVVTFPTPFVVTPRVFATGQTSVPGSEVKQVWVSSVSTTGFTGWVLRTNTTKTTIAWQAYAPTSGVFNTGQPAYASLLGAVSSAAMVPQRGAVSITPTANTPTSQVITFPVAFASIPTVLTTALTGFPGSAVKETSAVNVTLTQATIVLYRTSGTATTVNWIALGRL